MTKTGDSHNKKMVQRKLLVTDTTLGKSSLYLTETYLTIRIRSSIFKQHAHILSVLSVLENVSFQHKNKNFVLSFNFVLKWSHSTTQFWKVVYKVIVKVQMVDTWNAKNQSGSLDQILLVLGYQTTGYFTHCTEPSFNLAPNLLYVE